jgi:hypothetical protein
MIDATCKKRPYAARHTFPDAVRDKARKLVLGKL